MGKIGDLDSKNMYAYCANNPVMYTDNSGYSWDNFWNSVGSFFADPTVQIITGCIIILLLGALAVASGGASILVGAFWGASIGGVFGGLAGGITSYADGGSFFEGFASGFISGTITGAITGAAAAGLGEIKIMKNAMQTSKAIARLANVGFQTVGNGAISFAGSAIQGLSTGEFSLRNSLTSAVFGSIGGGLGSFFGTASSQALQKFSTGIRSWAIGFGLSASEFAVGLGYFFL